MTLTAPETTLTRTDIEAFLTDQIDATDLPAPQFGPLGKVVYERTYSRDIYLVDDAGLPRRDDGGTMFLQPWWRWEAPRDGRTKETWADTCRRVVLGNLDLDAGLDIEARMDEAVELFEAMYTFKVTPAGRHLWVTGTGSEFVRNCWSAPMGDRTSDHVRFGAMRLFEGGGVGSNYSADQMAATSPITGTLSVSFVCRTDHKDHPAVAAAAGGALAEPDAEGDVRLVVEDTREGWVETWCALIDMATSCTGNTHVVMDVSGLRPFGAPLRTFGGTASGPAPLVGSITRIVNVLNGACGRRLSGLEMMSIDHEVASAVIAGGSRRSARMALMSWTSPEIMEFIRCKADHSYHWTTNISVEIDAQFRRALDDTGHPQHEHAERVLAGVAQGMALNGEPGLIDTGLINDTRDPLRGNPIRHVNPCLSGDTLITTPAGDIPIRDLVGRGRTEVVVRAGTWATDERGFFRTGHRDVVDVTVRSVTGDERTVRCTPDHRFSTDHGWIEAQHLTRLHHIDLAANSTPDTRVYATLVSITAAGREDVYDASVPGINAFVANGVVVHNCGEATLEVEPNDGDTPGSGESCNLGSVNLDAFGTDDAGARRAFELMGRFLYRATFKPYGDPAAARIEDRNRRIGAGIYGFQGWCAAHGIPMSQFPDRADLHTILASFQDAAYDAACDVADAHGTPRPISATVVAPTGSIAQLSGATSGINPVYSPYFIRRVRFGEASQAWRDAEAAGYVVERDTYADSTMVVEYPSRDAILDRYDESLIEGSFDIPFETYMRIVAAVQASFCGGTRGQAVSHTAQLRAGMDPDALAESLRGVLGQVKGVTAFPEVSRPQSPLEAIDAETFEDYTRFREAITTDSNDGSCATGACPVK